MSKAIKVETSSEEESARQESNIESMVQKLSMKVLRSAETVLDEQLLSSFHKRYEELAHKDKSAVDFLQFMIYSMLNYIDRLQQTFEMDVVQEDYQVLQEAVQKSQAEIRKHIRIEQQLKIYLDSLEEKVENYEKKLALEEMKYSQLFESMKEIDEERRELHKKLAKFQEGRGTKEEIRDKSKSQSNYSTINDQLYKDYFGARKIKANKGKHVIDKINDRSRKLSSNQKSGGNLHFVDGAIQINLSNNIVVSKKSSYDQNLTKGQQVASHNSSIRQLTKTVNMKQQPAHGPERRPNRKISKYKTETSEIDKKDCRSNSVCN